MNFQPVDLLVHSSNVLMLASYSVRNMLWLRWFAVAAAITVMPYYLAQAVVLWPPVFWGAVFTVINLYQIARIYLERRPVVLSAEEQKLYDLGFHALRPREFLSLTLIGEWKTAAAGDRLLVEGDPSSSICIATEGLLDVRRGAKHLATLKPGYIIGTALAFTGNPSGVSASFAGPGRYIDWPLASLRSFLDQRPELRMTLQRLVNHDLARKLELELLASETIYPV
ncbi:MAG TPA: hypothetical protein VE046_06495 [Steroidobacteraceae bacterium]|nr:hypothetical protein [Steroidobacteraceae bacterium]